MTKYRSKYTEDEDDFLRTWKARRSYAWIGEKLGRTERSVHCRAIRLKLPTVDQLLTMRKQAFIEKVKRKDAPLLKEDGFIKPPSLEKLMGKR